MAIKILEKPDKQPHRVFQITCTCGCKFECDETDIDIKKAADHRTIYVYGEVECPNCKKICSATSNNIVYNMGAYPYGITSFGREVGYSPDGKPVPPKEKPDYFADENNMHEVF